MPASSQAVAGSCQPPGGSPKCLRLSSHTNCPTLNAIAWVSTWATVQHILTTATRAGTHWLEVRFTRRDLRSRRRWVQIASNRSRRRRTVCFLQGSFIKEENGSICTTRAKPELLLYTLSGLISGKSQTIMRKPSRYGNYIIRALRG